MWLCFPYKFNLCNGKLFILSPWVCFISRFIMEGRNTNNNALKFLSLFYILVILLFLSLFYILVILLFLSLFYILVILLLLSLFYILVILLFLQRPSAMMKSKMRYNANELEKPQSKCATLKLKSNESNSEVYAQFPQNDVLFPSRVWRPQGNNCLCSL